MFIEFDTVKMFGQQRCHFYTVCYKFIQVTACKKYTNAY